MLNSATISCHIVYQLTVIVFQRFNIDETEIFIIFIDLCVFFYHCNMAGNLQGSQLKLGKGSRGRSGEPICWRGYHRTLSRQWESFSLENYLFMIVFLRTLNKHITFNKKNDYFNVYLFQPHSPKTLIITLEKQYMPVRKKIVIIVALSINIYILIFFSIKISYLAVDSRTWEKMC